MKKTKTLKIWSKRAYLSNLFKVGPLCLGFTQTTDRSLSKNIFWSFKYQKYLVFNLLAHLITFCMLHIKECFRKSPQNYRWSFHASNNIKVYLNIHPKMVYFSIQPSFSVFTKTISYLFNFKGCAVFGCYLVL